MTTQHRPDDALEDFTALLLDDQATFDNQIDPDVRRKNRRRGLIITTVVLTVILASGGGYVGWALTAPLSDPVATSQAPTVPIPAAASIPLPPEGASAIAISGADEYLGATASTVWATSGTDEPRPIASISKLITALVVLDAVPLADATDPGPTLWFDSADYALYDKYYLMGATIAAMPRGSSMSLRDALATMLIPSASNYAEAVAGWAFGSQNGFVGAARRWLDANGLTSTTIVEPTGINPRNTSTPTDLIALGRLAAANPTIAQIVSTRGLTLPGPGPMSNTNGLLGSHGITGLKTGTLDPGGSNLLYTATLDVGAAQPLEIVGVVLGGSSREAVNHSVTSLLDGIAGGFTQVPLADEGQQVGSYTTPWGSTAQMVLSEDASVFSWSDTPITVTMDTTTPTTWQDGELVGSVTWTCGPNTVTVPVEIEGSITPPDHWWKLTHPDELG
ncbi:MULTISPECIES: D-alanyl-D-alanine carboxypeptidase [unclassified Microbacterium]|uniref:D-alanyl-D-alanine carboxypeptidase n=1 Tax=unclassified Microbacterium TaxID=2609290 RepID=UPI00214C1005|nr:MULTISPECIES: D-alanyl-D-alanine carboxypeptidase [unclassified Microbacterium]MCR2784000.1 D-alanyl-D-alanine carboxypeptidase [Microbacterium sp. zg.B96]WIM15157.1 D-alanyl-D-alanine carboxypeptidase [Microbacterium sp. zg-B96]